MTTVITTTSEGKKDALEKRSRRENGAGTVVAFRDRNGRRQRYKIGITLPSGVRQFRVLKPGTTEERAKEILESKCEKAKSDPRGQLVEQSASPAETFAQWAKRWLNHREARGLSSIRDDRTRLRKHVEPVLGALGIAAVCKADIRLLVQRLDDKVREGDLKWKTAHHVWTLTRCAFKDACSSKRVELVVREDDPTDKVMPPDRGDELARTYLYPSEFEKLITCKDVPVAWRRLYVLAAYTFSRAGELSVLRWDAVDLKHGVINFRQATDRRKKGAVKSTKTGESRRIPIEPTLRPLLEALLREATTAYVIHVPVSKRADTLREHLELAGLKRAELFAPKPDVAATWAPLTFHDLRGTGVTWMALRGDEPLVIQQRAGHANFETTQGYLREAETLGNDGGEPFPPLPEALFDPRFDPKRSKVAKSLSGTRGSNTQKSARSEAFPTNPGPSSPPEERFGAAKSRIAGEQIDFGSTEAGAAPPPADAVEAALAEALVEATKAGRWDLVAQLAGELEARRNSRQAPNVVALPPRGVDRWRGSR